MIVDILFAVIIIFFTFIMVKNYLRAREMVVLAKNAQFPRPNQPLPTIMTPLGKMEEMGYDTKKWKTKRLLFSIMTTMFVGLGIFTLFSDAIGWSNILVFFIIPMNMVLFNRVPSFLIMKNGIYVDEWFYSWDRLKNFAISPVRMGDDGYGMFDNSTAYTEIRFNVEAKLTEPKSIHILEKDEVEQVRQLLKEHGILEVEKNMKKQRTN